MSIFSEQLRNRVKKDTLAVNDNLKRLGDAVNGKESAFYRAEGDLGWNIAQIKKICQSLGLVMPEKIKEYDNIDEQINHMLQPSGATKRQVELNDIWWKNADGPLLAEFADTGKTIALLSDTFGGYYYMDPESGRKVKVNKKNKDQFGLGAYCFYKPLPDKALSGKDFIRILLKQLNRADILLLALSILCVTLFGTLTPFATQYAFEYMIPTGEVGLLISLGVLLLATAIGSFMMNTVKASVMARINTRLDTFSENAVYARVLRLPVSFFSNKSAGGLAQKVITLNMVPGLITQIIFGTFLQVLISVIYIVQLFFIAEPLVLPVFVIYVTEIVLFLVTVVQERKLIEKRISGEEKNSSLVFALLSGIEKIKVSGSEDRAYSKWMETYSERTRPAYTILFPASVRAPLITAVHMLGMLWIYIIAYQNGVTVSQFAAFSSAFGMAMAGISALSGTGSSFASIAPILRNGAPILSQEPEKMSNKINVSNLSGRIELNQVIFRYSEDGPAILDGIDLQIDPGEYVAVVGKSGCGKSTLMRLLLGFETPQQGAVYYDGLDIDSLDKRSLRRNIGTVLQDGKLFTGDIYSNITITAPWMDMDDAWDAAEKAGMADDIRRMPMGMYTLISEGGGGISGGQKQRLLIARAICPKPGILMFDEATSALDNLTQKIVTDSMNEMKCTRIVIAHRLSTIKECDRILVIDHGKIVEDGTYDELLSLNGIFTELVNRQLVVENE